MLENTFLKRYKCPKIYQQNLLFLVQHDLYNEYFEEFDEWKFVFFFLEKRIFFYDNNVTNYDNIDNISCYNSYNKCLTIYFSERMEASIHRIDDCQMLSNISTVLEIIINLKNLI